MKKILALSIALGLAACTDEPAMTDKPEAKTPAAQTADVAPPRANPLLVASTLPLMAPPFNIIQDADYEEAIVAGMVKHKAEIAAIADSQEPATFENTIVVGGVL